MLTTMVSRQNNFLIQIICNGLKCLIFIEVGDVDSLRKRLFIKEWFRVNIQYLQTFQLYIS